MIGLTFEGTYHKCPTHPYLRHRYPRSTSRLLRMGGQLRRKGTRTIFYGKALINTTQDWERLAKCIAPTLLVDYRSFLDKKWDAMPAAEFVAMASSKQVLGDPLLKTQHFIGGTKWEYISETEAMGYHQLRVPHQRYVDDSMATVLVKGHGA